MDCDGGLGEEAAYQSVAEYEAWAKATIAARDAELAALRKQVEVMREALTKIASVETRPQDKETWLGRAFLAMKRTARVALESSTATDAACRAAGVEVED